jgi:hypothetical protein
MTLSAVRSQRAVFHLRLSGSYRPPPVFGGAPLSAATCVAVDVPAAIRGELNLLYPGWSIVTLNELAEYEQKLWLAARKGCPGVTAGRFVPYSDPAYASVLIKRDGGSVLQVGAVYWVGSDSVVRSKVFAPACKATYTCVVWIRHEKRPDELDEINYEAMEVGSSAFSWRQGGFTRRTLSQ